MTNFKIIDYTNWDKKFREIGAKADNQDNIKGLSGSKEIIDFYQQTYECGYDISEVNELFGLHLSKTRKNAKSQNSSDAEYSELANFFNSLEYFKRSDIIDNANDIGYKKLYKLEGDVNKAFEKCKGYQLVNARPSRFDNTTTFNLKEVHDDVKTALDSLNELQKELEKAYDEAKGKSGSVPEKKDYDSKLKDLEKTYLGESYEQFVRKYGNDVYDPTQDNKEAYYKAHEYVKAIKKYTREELQRVRTESGERMLDETIQYSNSMIDMIDFASNDISSKTISEMKSEIMRAAFTESIRSEYIKTDTKEIEAKENKAGKYYDKENGLYIKDQNNNKYDINGVKQQNRFIR